jgi:hypothetical protein
MPSRWEQIVVDAEDPARLARWWAEALGYRIVHEQPDEVEIRRTPDELPGLLFTPVPEGKPDEPTTGFTYGTFRWRDLAGPEGFSGVHAFERGGN